MSQSHKKILFIVTGSIALYKVAYVLSDLKKKGHSIKVVATESALKFVGLSTLEGLTSEKIYTDLYASGSNMDHIHLIRWADIIAIAPATANYINKLAAGIGDDLASTIMLAHDFTKPALVFPAMNTKMYEHPATQTNINSLKKWGYKICDSNTGQLACGETGVGRLLEPSEVISHIEQNLASVSESNKLEPAIKKSAKSSAAKVLITAGGTQEPIDNVRSITNVSSGKTAAHIANVFIEQGLSVTYVCAENSVRPLFDCKILTFKTFKDLETTLNQELTHNYSIIIHAAAVSDYSVKEINATNTGKINSSQDELIITLKKNPKLINNIKKISPDSKLVGFKLTSSHDQNEILSKVNSLFENANCDFVVHNDYSSIQSGHHTFNIYQAKQLHKPSLSLNDLAYELCLTAIKEVP